MALIIYRRERVCATHFLRPKAVGRVGFKSDLPIDGYHRQMVNRILSPTLPEYRPARWARWRAWRWAVGNVGKPERLRGGCGSVGSGWVIWGNRCYMETRKAVFRRSVRVFCVVGLCACGVVGGLHGNQKRFVGRMVALSVSGNSLGFRGLCRFGVDYCTWGNLECAIFGVLCGRLGYMGRPLPLLPWWNLERSFCMGGNLGFYRLRELNRLFGGYGNLKGLFVCVKTSVCGSFGNLEGAFWDSWKLRGGFLGVWKLSLLAHTKLSVCIRGLRETSGLLCVGWNLERVRWWFHVVGWLYCVVRWSWVSFGGRCGHSSFPHFGKLGGFVVP